MIKCIVVLLSFKNFLETTNKRPVGTPETGSGLSIIVFYDPNNEVIRRCLRFSYHLYIGGDYNRREKSRDLIFLNGDFAADKRYCSGKRALYKIEIGLVRIEISNFLSSIEIP